LLGAVLEVVCLLVLVYGLSGAQRAGAWLCDTISLTFPTSREKESIETRSNANRKFEVFELRANLEISPEMTQFACSYCGSHQVIEEKVEHSHLSQLPKQSRGFSSARTGRLPNLLSRDCSAN
jgi:hypothetical protein